MIESSTGLRQYRDQLIGKVWRGIDPYAGFALDPANVDIQGWGGSEHPCFEDVIAELRPRVIVEIGVWKGASAVHMGKILQRHGIDGVVIAVDTWLGSVEHWINSEWFAGLRVRQGRQTIQQTFMSNVVSEGLQDTVLPLPLDSGNAAELLSAHGVEADLIHIDAGHDYRSVSSDVALWWPRLRPGGVMIGDDYFSNGNWPGVKAAFDEFTARNRLAYDDLEPKIRIRKPSAAAPARRLPNFGLS